MRWGIGFAVLVVALGLVAPGGGVAADEPVYEGASPPTYTPVYTPAKLPSNRFRFAGLRLNRGNGRAVLWVRVPAAGELFLWGRGVRRVRRVPRQATVLPLPVKPKVRLLRWLRRHGKGRIRVEVAFEPLGGVPSSRERVIVLRKRR